MARKAAKKVTKRKDGKPSRAEKRAKNQKAFRRVQPKIGFKISIHKGSRTTYDEELVKIVLEEVSCGSTLRASCREHDINEATFRTWVHEDRGRDPQADPPREGLSSRYARARELQAEAWADDLMDIADGSEDGVDTQSSKLRTDTRKWLMGKNHIRFADKSTTVLEGNPDKPVRQITSEMSVEDAAEMYEASIRDGKKQS
jgi:hypothetical protein